MVNPQVSLLDLTVDAAIPSDVMRALICGKNIVFVPRHDGLLENIEEDLNTTSDEDSNATCDEDLNKHMMRMRIPHVMRIRIHM